MNLSFSSDVKVKRAFTHKLADISNGVSLQMSELGGSVVAEGTAVGKGSDDLFHVIKTAKLTAPASSSATTYVVAKGHHFRVGDVIMAKTAGKAYPITAIATNASDSTSDDITVGTTLGVSLAVGDGIIQAKQEAASASAFKYTPVGLTGEAYEVNAAMNNDVNVVTIGQVHEALIPSAPDSVKAALKGIIFI